MSTTWRWEEEGEKTQALWENHQSEINGNILFFLSVCGQAEQEIFYIFCT